MDVQNYYKFKRRYKNYLHKTNVGVGNTFTLWPVNISDSSETMVNKFNSQVWGGGGIYDIVPVTA